MGIVVRRDQKQSLAARLPRERSHRIDQRRTDTLVGLQTVERDDLARAAVDTKRDQPDDLAAAPRDETGQFVRTINDAARNYDLRAPLSRREIRNPAAVGGCERLDDIV